MAEDHRSLEVFRTPHRVYADFFAHKPAFWRRARTLDPSAGDGRMIAHLIDQYGNRRRHGIIDVRRSEKKRWRRIPNVDWCVKNFRQFHTRQEYDAVVTNPPFSLAYEFVDRALTFVRPGGMVCILQKLQWLGTQERSRRHRQSCLHTTLVIPYRICWEIDGRPDNRSDNVEYAWFCFKRDYGGPKFIDWVCEDGPPER